MKENKEIMAENIKFFMKQKQVNSSEVCKALGFKQNTFSNWINAKIYPRIDKIELMANYFGVSKAELVEPHPAWLNDLNVPVQYVALDSFSTPEEFEKAYFDRSGGRLPIKLNDEEYGIIVHYRAADDIDRRSVLRILGLEKKGEEKDA